MEKSDVGGVPEQTAGIDLVQQRMELDAKRYRAIRNTPPWNSRVVVLYGDDTPDDTVLLTGEQLDTEADALLAELSK